MSAIKKIIACLLICLTFLPGLVTALEGNGSIPEVGKISGPSTTQDITKDMGIFANMGKFILEYAVNLAIFVMVLAVVILSVRESWARSNNKVDDAVDTQKNQKGLIIDGILAMAALLFIFYIDYMHTHIV